MNILNPLKFAYIGLKTNKVRSILTMIGIIIGITAVIVVMSAGEGIKGFVLNPTSRTFFYPVWVE